MGTAERNHAKNAWKRGARAVPKSGRFDMRLYEVRFGLDIRGYLCVIVITFRQYEGVRGLDIFIFDSPSEASIIEFFHDHLSNTFNYLQKKADLVLVLRLLSAKVMP